MKTGSTLFLVCLFGCSLPLRADWWVDASALAAHGGGASRQSFPTRAEAEAFISRYPGNGLRLVPGGFDRQAAGPLQNDDQAATDAAAKEAEEEQARREADAKLAAEKAAHDAEVARQFQQSKLEALSQLRGVSKDRDFDSGLKDIGPTDSGLKVLSDINTDTSVVDARNVPTGLPKDVEDAIPQTPAGANVRKGFEAIMHHDWKVALAWFQVALNHEPGNPGLERLVDLAQYTLQKQSRATSARSGREDAAQINRALDDYSQSLLSKYPELRKNMTSDSDDEFLKREDPAWIQFFRYITSKLPRSSPGKPLPTFDGIRG